MHYKVAIIDDNAADTEYVSTLVTRWAEEHMHAVALSTFPAAEAFLFQYEDERDFDITYFYSTIRIMV